MKNIFLLLLVIIGADSAVAQTNIRQFWGRKGYDAAFSAAATNDGGYIISGLTISGADTVEGDIIIIKTTAHGDTIWTRTVGGPKLEGGNYVMQTSDGGYMVSGHTEDFGAQDCDAFLMKLDKAGNQQWMKIYGSVLDDISEGVIELPGEGYVFAGITENFGAGPDEQRSAWFVKTNMQGDTLWTRSYGGPRRDYAYSVVHQPGGGLLAVGFSDSYSDNGAENAWLLRLKDNGDTTSTTLYRTPGNSRFHQIIPVADGGFIIAGYTRPGLTENPQGFVVKLDAGGQELWEKTYGTVAQAISFAGVAELPNGNLLLSGLSYEQDAAGHAYIMTIDASGNVVSDAVAGPSASYASCIASHEFTSFLVAGAAVRTGDPGGDIYFMEHDATIAGLPQIHEVTPIVYPNPVRNMLTILLPANLASQSTAIRVTSMSGQNVYTSSTDAGKDIIIDCSHFAKGVYAYRIVSQSGVVLSGRYTIQ